MSDEELISAVAKHVAEMGWSGFTSIADDNEEASWMAEGGWTAIYDVVSNKGIDYLRSNYSYLYEEEE